jgi:small acid-soluble spore protein D (minor alpha/beta-type SASP)
MSRRSRRNPLVPDSKEALSQLRLEVAQEIGLPVSQETDSPNGPDAVTKAAADEFGVPLQESYNGSLTSHDAGRLGGHLGGQMVRRLIAKAQSLLAAQPADGGAAGAFGRETSGPTAGKP